MNETLLIKNCRLETGFKKSGNTVSQTETALVDLLIEKGKISQIIQEGEGQLAATTVYDAKGQLVLPGFVESHSHLDKSRLGTPWKAVKRVPSIIERFEDEMIELKQLDKGVQERAEILLDTYRQNGVTAIRTHVDVHPTVGLEHLAEVMDALTNQQKMDFEVVAFPQHGLLRSNSVDLMKQALKKGATIVGGVDPTAVDQQMEKSLAMTFELAMENNARIDLHLHERGEMGIKTFNELIRLTNHYHWQGKVAVSHGFGLRDVTGSRKEELFQNLNEAKIEIITSVPNDPVIPSMLELASKGVTTKIGCDNIFDNWSPYGNGDILERASRFGELFNQVTEFELSRTLGLITNGVTPLNDEGEQVWPKIEDKATFVFTNASCSAEAVARRTSPTVTMYQGRITSGVF
ncbi:amidohydrolase [Carnobacterium divergens]|uniref:amidohydrolase n=1 Tax=Carnobacterium divergens TaxID=2748 RepID=UPI001071E37D|nr:amidohydrolase [Carnobacterium divergens]TFI71722.1 deaminase [Carnobacterium divergens]